jgi:nitronate monooxygenase
MRTRFTELIGCEAPIQLAAMGGGIGVPRLAFAVAAAGGLGMMGTSGIDRQTLLDALEGRGGRPEPERHVGVGFLVPLLDRETVAAVAPLAQVIEFFYGRPDPGLVQLGRSGGALVSWQVGSVEEAVAAEAVGCDFVVAQGVEAGGHVRGRIGVLALLDAVLDSVGVPVLAAGGVGSVRGVAAALAAGADGVRVGTRFLLATEAPTHPDYRASLIAAQADDTAMTEAFHVGWPGAPHRVLRSCLGAAGEQPDAPSGATRPDGHAVPRWASTPPTDTMTGSVTAMAHYAGESVGAATAVVPAADIVRELSEGAEELLRRRARDLWLDGRPAEPSAPPAGT